MRRTFLIALSVGVAGAGFGSPGAVAHGPCRCLDPTVTQPGSVVRIESEGLQSGVPGYPAYRVIFNPSPRDFGIAPDYLASAHRADAPATTVLSRPRRQPTRRGRFRVPRATPPGLYTVLIWDGEEGGGHNTWDYVHVTEPGDARQVGVIGQSASPRPAAVDTRTRPVRSESEGSPRWPLLAGVGATGLILGFVAARVAYGRRASA